MRRFLIILAALLVCGPVVAQEAPAKSRICGSSGANCATVTGGKLDVNATVSATATTTARATASAPSYSEGTEQPLSQTLGGELRIAGTISASSSTRNTSAEPSYTNGTDNPFSADLAGRLRVTGSGGTFPVTGTFWQATQPVSGTLTCNAGTGTMAVSGTFWQATQPVSGTFWQATQPVSLASVPTHAVTQSGAWTVSGTGTAGTPASGVVSVQGVAGGTAVPVSGTFWQATQPVSGTFWQATQPVSAASLPLPSGAAQDRTTAAAPLSVRLSDGSAFYNATGGGGGGTSSSFAAAFPATGTASGAKVVSSAPTYTNGNMEAPTLDTSGALRVNVVTGGGSNASVGTTGSAAPASATYAGVLSGANLVGMTQPLTDTQLRATSVPTADTHTTAAVPLSVRLSDGSAFYTATGGGGGGSTFGAAFPSTGTAIGAKDSSGANMVPLNLDASGYLRVNVSAGGGAGGTSSSYAAAFPATGTAAGAKVVSSAPTYTNGNMEAPTLDTAGNLRASLATTDTVQSGCVLNALNATCQVDMVGKSSAGFVVTAISSPSGITLIGEVSKDGTNWGQRPLVNSSNETRYYSVPNGDLAVGVSRTITMGGGGGYVRVRASTWTSGSATVTVRATDTADSVLEPTIGNALKPTFTACTPALANTAASSALACEAGASKGFRVRALYVQQPGAQTTAGNRVLTFRRTTTAGSGGTGLTLAPVDATDTAFSGTCRTKGTAGTAGTTLGTRHVWTPTTVANLAMPLPIWPIGAVASGTTVKDVLVPAGTANGVEVSDPGATGGANLYLCIVVTEE